MWQSSTWESFMADESPPLSCCLLINFFLSLDYPHSINQQLYLTCWYLSLCLVRTKSNLASHVFYPLEIASSSNLFSLLPSRLVPNTQTMSSTISPLSWSLHTFWLSSWFGNFPTTYERVFFRLDYSERKACDIWVGITRDVQWSHELPTLPYQSRIRWESAYRIHKVRLAKPPWHVVPC